jgi:GNAT superfamily N-acetyltransferase
MPPADDAPHSAPAAPAAPARPVDVAVVHPLRMEVLRRGRPPGSSVYVGDDDPAARHVAVFAGDDVFSVGSVFPDTAPWAPARRDAWRVRGMATREGRRGRGLGHSVLSALIEHARANGGRFIWCEARIGAIPFYERAGFVTEGQPFVMDDVDHIHMGRDL